MNILYIYDGDWPHNATRVEKQTRSLAEAGHSVTLLSRNPSGRPREDRTPWMRVRRLPAPHRGILSRVVNYPVFLNPVWLWQIWRSAREGRSDCIIVRDLPLAPAAMAVGKLLGLPIHYDMAEAYPVAFRAFFPNEMSLVRRCIQRTQVVDWTERFVLHRVDRVFVVSEESRARCLRLGVPEHRVVIVGNTPANVAQLIADHTRPDEIADWAERRIILFIGNIFDDRGLSVTVDAMPTVLRSVPDAALVVVGDGRGRPAVEERVRQRGLGAQVRFVGWKPHHEHAAFYRHAAVGVLPFLPTAHLHITLANKLFDYMGAGLPVVASDVPPMRRIIDETGGGVLIPPNNATALAGAIASLLQDRERRLELGRCGRRAVTTRYRWKNDVARLIAAVESFRPGVAGSRPS